MCLPEIMNNLITLVCLVMYEKRISLTFQDYSTYSYSVIISHNRQCFNENFGFLAEKQIVEIKKFFKSVQLYKIMTWFFRPKLISKHLHIGKYNKTFKNIWKILQTKFTLTAITIYQLVISESVINELHFSFMVALVSHSLHHQKEII